MIVPKLRAPIVLVPGLLGFGRLRVGGWTLASYFSNIPDHLEAAGNRVLVAALAPTGGVVQRAHDLKAFLDREAPGEAVHIIGHSMAGLDSRYLISSLGMAPRVLSLTTVGTPHRGTAFADWCVHRLDRLVRPCLDWLGVPAQAFYDLTTEKCREFNEAVPDAPSVRYFSIAGRQHADYLSPEWRWPHHIVLASEGPNDGVVSVASATYGETMEVWETDHLGLVNWPNPVARALGRWSDRAPAYASLVRRLADEGF
jgi:triacylglycerol lipase